MKTSFQLILLSSLAISPDAQKLSLRADSSVLRSTAEASVCLIKEQNKQLNRLTTTRSSL